MNEPVTRTFLVVDIEKSSDRENEELPVLRGELYSMLHEARAAAGLLDGKTVTEDRGDGVLVIADASVIVVLSRLTQKLIDELSRYNATVDPPAWLRLRIAVHCGLVHHDPRGWSSDELTRTFRICDLPESKEALSAAHRAQAVVIVSDHVFGTVVKHGYSKLPKDSFGEIKDGVAWAWVPGYQSPPGSAAVSRSGAEPKPSSHQRSVSNSVSGTVTGNVFQGSEFGHVDARNYFRGPQ